MLAHIADALRMATGELDIPPMRLASRHFPFRQGVLLWIYLLPFPHGAPTAPELIARTGVPAEESRRDIARLLDDFAARRTSIDGRDHPAFGPLSARTWGVLTYRHLDHHLRQFGV